MEVFSRLMAPVLEQIAKLWARIDLMPAIRWGTVRGINPLSVTLDGDTDPLPFPPSTTVLGLTLGARVVCVEQHRRVIVIASQRPAMAAGVAAFPNIPAGGTRSVTVTFPVGRFSVAPVVVVTPRSGVPQLRASSDSARSASSFTITQYNGTGSPGFAPVNWVATQMSADSASG